MCEYKYIKPGLVQTGFQASVDEIPVQRKSFPSSFLLSYIQTPRVFGAEGQKGEAL